LIPFIIVLWIIVVYSLVMSFCLLFIFSMSKKAFTLVEMLIVIVIIGILAVAIIPRLQSAQGRARDTVRQANMRDIITSVELYHIENWHIPFVTSYGEGIATWEGWSDRCFIGWFMTFLETEGYMKKVPRDPQSNGPSRSYRYYCSQNYWLLLSYHKDDWTYINYANPSWDYNTGYICK